MAAAFPAALKEAIFRKWDKEVGAAVHTWCEQLGPSKAALAQQILAEQMIDSFEKAAMIAGRLLRTKGRKRTPPCQPEEALISGADDPEHPDRPHGASEPAARNS